MTVEITIPVKDVPDIMGAAKELGIESIKEPGTGEHVVCHFLIADYYQLILIGIIAGMNINFKKMKEPFDKIYQLVEDGVEKINKTKKDEQSKLG